MVRIMFGVAAILLLSKGPVVRVVTGDVMVLIGGVLYSVGLSPSQCDYINVPLTWSAWSSLVLL